MEVARYTAQRQAKGLGKIAIKVELRKRGHKHKVIRAAFEGIDTLWPVDGCADVLFKKFNGLTKPGRMIIETGLNAGYNRKTVYRALVRLGAELKKRGKKSMWKFGPWVTERRPFLDEVQGHVGDDEEIGGKTSKTKRTVDERGQSRDHRPARKTSNGKQASSKMGPSRARSRNAPRS